MKNNDRTDKMLSANFILKPELIARHQEHTEYIGAGIISLKDNSLLLVVPNGLPPIHFEAHAAEVMPEVYRSYDNGRSWQYEAKIAVEHHVAGALQHISLEYLEDGRLVLISGRNVRGLHGGGVPSISFSSDNGRTWTPLRKLIDDDDVFYVMNDRLLISSGNNRLFVPVSEISRHKDPSSYIEGDACDARCFYSDDLGASWTLSEFSGRAFLDNDARGMAEPCIAELDNGRLIMLARTGAGCLHRSYSDDGGESWAKPEKTSLISPCSSLNLKKMPDGRLIVLYNHSKPLESGAFFPRNPLVYAISEDNGMSWSSPVVIDESGKAPEDGKHRQHIYPTLCFTGEGMIIIYSTHHADPKGRFLQGKKIMVEDGGLKIAIVKV